MHVKFLELFATDELRKDLDVAYARVVESGRFIRSQECATFESSFAKYCGAKHCVGVASGLDAITLSLKALNFEDGFEVIVPGHTFIATWLAVVQAGGVPVPVDVSASDMNLDIRLIEAAVTEKTRAIIAVHLYGWPADMSPIMRLADRSGLKVIEDAAQAHGAIYNGERVGGIGHISAFSFYPGKNLGAFGDGGAVVTNDKWLCDRVTELANYGSSVKYEHTLQGVNSRLDELQAAFLSCKLPYLDRWNELRSQQAKLYLTGIKNPLINLPLHCLESSSESVWHLFVVRTSERESLRRYLLGRGIDTIIHYPKPPHLQPAFSGEYGTLNLPVSCTISDQVLSLPIGPHLNKQSIEYVIEAVNAWS